MKTRYLLVLMVIAALLAGCDDTDPLVPDEDFILSIMVMDTDGQPEPGMTVARLNSLQGIVPSFSGGIVLEAADTLSSSYPNPFYGSTTVEYSIDDTREVLIEVLDWTGGLVRTVVNGRQNPVSHTVQWDQKDESGGTVINGVYFFKLTLSDTLDVHEMQHSETIDCTVFDLMERYRHDGMGVSDPTGFFSTSDLDLFPSIQGHDPQSARNAVGAETGTFSFSDTVTIRVSTPPPSAGGWIYHMSRDIALVDGPNYLEFYFVPDDSTEVFLEGR